MWINGILFITKKEKAVFVESPWQSKIHTKKWLLVCHALVAGVLFLILSGSTGAQDRAGEFLDKVRDRGWNDVALEYLEHASDDPLATPEFLKRVPLELAMTRRELARQTISEKERQTLLKQATAELRKFAAENPKSPLLILALSELGDIMADQGLTTLKKADQLASQDGTAADPLRKDARKSMEEASATLEQVEEAITLQLDNFSASKVGSSNKELLKQKQELEGKQAEVRFLLATLEFEKARTYPSISAERRDALEVAATGFEKLRDEYENKLVGFYAELYEGRCYQDMGNCKKAQEIFGALMNHPIGHADFRKLIARAVRYRAECYLAENKPDKAIEECSEWLDRSSGEEREQAEWLAVAYRLANAYTQKLEQNDANINVGRVRTEVRKLLRDVSRHPGEFQNEARAESALSGGSDAKAVEVKGFSDAFAAGKAEIEQMRRYATCSEVGR